MASEIPLCFPADSHSRSARSEARTVGSSLQRAETSPDRHAEAPCVDSATCNHSLVTGLPVRLSPNHLLGSVAFELSADPEITSPLEFGVPFLDFALSEQAKMAHIVSVD